MDNEMDKLVDRALEQILKDVASGDMTAVAELLYFVPQDKLADYLPETD